MTDTAEAPPVGAVDITEMTPELEEGFAEIQRRLEERRRLREAGLVAAPATAVPPRKPAPLVVDNGPDLAPLVALGYEGAEACPACGAWSAVPPGWTGYRCRACKKAWRWSVCESCHAPAQVGDTDRRWGCLRCGCRNTSWWHDPDAHPRVADIVAGRKRLAEEQVDKIRTDVRRSTKRTALVAAGLAAALVAVLAVRVALAPPTASEQTARVCSEVSRLQDDISKDRVSNRDIVQRVDGLGPTADKATPEIAAAAARLREGTGPRVAVFLGEVTAVCKR